MRSTISITRQILLTGAVCAALLIPASVVRADADGNPSPTSAIDRVHQVGTNAGYASEANDQTFSTILGRIIQAAISLLGVVFVVQLVYAGYIWLTARGEDEPIKKAKATIQRSVIGIIIVVTAWSITAFVLENLFLAVK
jgi:hypothetical protein